MVRAVVFSVCCPAIGGVLALMAAAGLTPSFSTLSESPTAGAALALAGASLLVSAGLCLAAGARRSVPSLAALVLPAAAALLAMAGLLPDGLLESLAASSAGGLTGPAVDRAAANVGATAFALLGSSAALLAALLVAASATEDDYEPASPDPLRWLWLGLGLAGAAGAAAFSVWPGGARAAHLGGAGVGLVLTVAILATGPALLLPAGRKNHDLLEAPRRRLRAARALGAASLVGATACAALAARHVALAAALERLGDGGAGAQAAAELTGVLAASTKLVVLAPVLATVAAAAILARTLVEPLRWLPPVALVAATVAGLAWTDEAVGERTRRQLGPPCASDCLPGDLVPTLLGTVTVATLAPEDPCDPPPAAWTRLLDAGLEPVVAESSSCPAGIGVLVSLSPGAIAVEGLPVLAVERGSVAPSELAHGSGGTTLPALVAALERASNEGRTARVVVLADRRTPAGLADLVVRSVAAAGATDLRLVVSDPSRTRPPAFRELDAPVPTRTVEGGPEHVVVASRRDAACGGAYRAGEDLVLELRVEPRCPPGRPLAAESWQAHLGDDGRRVVGPWGLSREARSEVVLASEVRGLVARRRTTPDVPLVLRLVRPASAPFARDLELRAALDREAPGLFAAVVPEPSATRRDEGRSATGAPRRAWAVSFGGPGADAATAVGVTPGGSIAVAGAFGALADLDPGEGVDEHRGRGTANTMVLALDPEGRRLWARSLRGLRRPAGGGIGLHPDGSVVIAGDFWGSADLAPAEGGDERTSEGERSTALVRFDPTGSVAWAHVLTARGARVEGRAAAAAADGSVAFAGSFSGTVDFDPGPGERVLRAWGESDVFVSRYDSDGTHLWTRAFGGQAGDHAADVAIAPDGSIVVAALVRGRVDLDPGEAELVHEAGPRGDVVLLRLSPDGDMIWSRVVIDVRERGRASVHGVAALEDGSIALACAFAGTVLLDPSGNREAPSTGREDLQAGLVLLLEPTGVLRRALVFESDVEAAVLDVSAAPAGGVALAGQFRGTLDLDPSEERDGRRSAGDSDAFVVVLDANGDVLRSWTAGGPGADAVLGVASPTDGSLIAVGSFSRGARLDPTEPEREHVSVGETDAFVLRLPTGDP